MLSNGMIKKFVKDCGLPIHVFEPRAFEYFLKLYEPLFSSNTLYKQYCETVDRLGGEENYSNHTKALMECMITDISQTIGYQRLAILKEPPVKYNVINQINKKNIYHSGFDGKTLISIDLKKANFNALKQYDSSIVLDSDTYEDLIYRYTSHEYITQSKQIRPVIFGNLLPSKQASIQKTMMHMIADNILTEYPYFELSMAGTDEIVVVGYDDLSPIEAYKRVMDCIPPYSLEFIKVEVFTLEQVHKEKPYFVKKPWVLGKSYDLDISDDAIITMEGYDTPVFKNIPSMFFAQVFKNYFGMELRKEDLMFYYEGCLAHFDKGIYK